MKNGDCIEVVPFTAALGCENHALLIIKSFGRSDLVICVCITAYTCPVCNKWGAFVGQEWILQKDSIEKNERKNSRIEWMLRI